MALRSKGRDTYLDHLGEVPLFASFNKKELQKIAKASTELDVKAGKTLVEQGRVGHEFFLIVEGKASVKRNGRKVADLGPGDYFGELSLLSRLPRNADVVAEEDLKVLVLGQREFNGVLDEVPGLAHKMLATMAKRLREADAKAVGH